MTDESCTEFLELLIGFLGESTYIFHLRKWFALFSYYMKFLYTWNCRLKILCASCGFFSEISTLFMPTLWANFIHGGCFLPPQEERYFFWEMLQHDPKSKFFHWLPWLLSYGQKCLAFFLAWNPKNEFFCYSEDTNCCQMLRTLWI